MQRPDLSPRCGGPVIPYERPGYAYPLKYSALGAVIRQAREAAGLTRAQLAAAAGANSAQTVGKWEAGECWPSRSAAALERVLGVELPGPRCGRPENHRGRCRSAAAVARYFKQDGSRLVEMRRLYGREYGRGTSRRAA